MRTFKTISRFLFGVLFVAAGVNHFANPAFYLKMMPPVSPFPLALVYASGVFEIALGALLLIPKYRRLAAWGLILLLVAVFPANIYMALNTENYPEFSPAAIWLRAPFQFVLIAWAYWYGVSDSNNKSDLRADDF